MRKILQSLMATLNGYNVPAPAPQVEEEPDPRSVPVTITKGEFDDLYAKIREWEQFWTNKQNIQRRAIRRLFLLPKVLAKLLHASPVADPTVVSDGTVRYTIMGTDNVWLYLEISPFDSKVTAIDASGKEADVDFELRNSGADVYRTMVLQLLGFGEIAKRNAEQSSDSWVDEINTGLTVDRVPDTPASLSA